jgi:hypothetical protein
MDLGELWVLVLGLAYKRLVHFLLCIYILIICSVQASYMNQQDIQLMWFADYFGRAFAAVSASQFPWAKMFKESTVSKMVDVSYHITRYCSRISLCMSSFFSAHA